MQVINNTSFLQYSFYLDMKYSNQRVCFLLLQIICLSCLTLSTLYHWTTLSLKSGHAEEAVITLFEVSPLHRKMCMFTRSLGTLCFSLKMYFVVLCMIFQLKVPELKSVIALLQYIRMGAGREHSIGGLFTWKKRQLVADTVHEVHKKLFHELGSKKVL